MVYVAASAGGTGLVPSSLTRWEGYGASTRRPDLRTSARDRRLRAMRVDGTCLCEAVSFRAEVNPGRVFVCHCTDCQTHSGSAFRTTALTERDAFELLSGEIREYIKTAESGAPRALGFCPACGTAIYGGPGPGERGPLSLRTGVLRQRDSLPPIAQVWCRSAQAWLERLDALPRIERQPS